MFSGEDGRTMAEYVDYLMESYRRNPGWSIEHREWLRRFGFEGCVLDAGAGLGHLARACAEAGRNAVGVERDSALIAAGRREVRFERMLQADVGQLPFRSQAFDWVISNQVIEHVVEPRRLLAEALRVLKPGGRLLLTTPNRRAHFATRRPAHFWAAIRGKARSDPSHVREFTPRELRRIMQSSGFSVEYEEAIGRLSGWWFSRPWAGGVLIVARRPVGTGQRARCAALS